MSRWLRLCLRVEGVLAALELPDFIFSGRPRAADFIANSVIAHAIVLGTTLMPLQGLDLVREQVVYEHNGTIVGTYTAAEVMGNPLNALAWLANHLASRGLMLKAGDIVMAGAVSKLLRPKAGDTVRASFAHLGSVSVNVVP
jgi:2-keto-4-pentenoate hydratase